ncbi:NAD(P)/FAD-dependent oxidoreductase, partial [Streptomyces sp. C1-2]|nr:NAD(P)/FAD-dependent oxidoreductase [Streptomyces sp. C1-2]
AGTSTSGCVTAQHAWRQGKTCAHNIAASFGQGDPRPYRHRDLGFVVDLGGVKAAANPLGIPLSGPLAGAVTRGYHLAAMPGNRIRVAADWLLDAVLPRQGVQLGLVRSWSVPLDTDTPELARMPGAPDRSGKQDGESKPSAENKQNKQAKPSAQGKPSAPSGSSKPSGSGKQGKPNGQSGPNERTKQNDKTGGGAGTTEGNS